MGRIISNLQLKSCIIFAVFMWTKSLVELQAELEKQLKGEKSGSKEGASESAKQELKREK